jgi:DHA1 family multidrug resistance protein-like MFS transporter
MSVSRKRAWLFNSLHYHINNSDREHTASVHLSGEKTANREDESASSNTRLWLRNSDRISKQHILVSWYGPHDEGNPQCWPFSVKLIIHFQINFYTFIVYMASSIFSVAEPEFMDVYGVPTAVSALGLSHVLLGYGVGALLFSPLSEIPAIGRNPPYVISLALFILVSGIAVAVDNVPGFLVLRSLQGFFGSPCLATGAASLTDITDIVNIPYGLWMWGTCAVAAPAVAPCIAGFSIMANGWKWSMWEILWGAAPCLISLVWFLLPFYQWNPTNCFLVSCSSLKRLFPPFYTSALRAYEP